ncbi:24905_t:CDS:1, partial [Gigaspora rosea]
MKDKFRYKVHCKEGHSTLEKEPESKPTHLIEEILSRIISTTEDFKPDFNKISRGHEPLKNILETIWNIRYLFIAYIWRFFVLILFLMYSYEYADLKTETVVVLVIDAFIVYIFINASLRMA